MLKILRIHHVSQLKYLPLTGVWWVFPFVSFPFASILPLCSPLYSFTLKGLQKIPSVWAAFTFALFQFSSPCTAPHSELSADAGGEYVTVEKAWPFPSESRGQHTGSDDPRPGPAIPLVQCLCNQGRREPVEHRAQSLGKNFSLPALSTLFLVGYLF